MAEGKQDVESGRQGIPHFKLILNQGIVTDEIVNYDYEGSGTDEDPYVVEWIENDPRNPMIWSQTRKWVGCICMAFATLTVSFCSSAFSGGKSCVPGPMFDLTNNRCPANPTRIRCITRSRYPWHLAICPRFRSGSVAMGAFQ